MCLLAGFFASMPAAVAQDSAASPTLARVKARGVVVCGVNTGLRGFARPDSLGVYSGLDSDFCQAVASAIFNDPDAVDYVPVSASERFTKLAAGDFDVLSRNTTWTLQRNSAYGEFTGVIFYDGQGFMVPKRSGIRSALELDNVPVCVTEGTTTELNTVDFFGVSEQRYKPVYFEDGSEAAQAYVDGKCGALTTDRSGLAALRAGFDTPDAHLVLPEVISKEPLGPMVRHGDAGWANVVRWTLNCLVNAEEMGIKSDNVSVAGENANPAAKRLLGIEGEFGAALGLEPLWCSNAIRHVGNYAEMYERNVGLNTPIGLPRGVNNLWSNGGLLYAPPIR